MRSRIVELGNRFFIIVGLNLLLTLTSASHASQTFVGSPPSGAPGSAPQVWPGTAIKTPPPVHNHEPTAADLAFGEVQLRKLLDDRPAMKGYAIPGDPVWTKAVRGLAGEACGYRVSWNTHDLDKPLIYASDHAFPHPPDYKAYIRIRAAGPDGPYGGEYLWSCFFFELFNLANHNGFSAIYEKSLTGTVSRQEWLTENTKLEFLAMQKMIAFYRGIWLPAMKVRGIHSDSWYWKNGEKETYEEWISQYTDENYYPYDYWGKYYDEAIVPYLEQLKNWKKHHK